MDEDEEDEDDWGFDDNEDFFDEPPAQPKNLTMKRNKPKKNLTMKR